MPVYEYICEVCGTDFEKMMRFEQSDQLPECPNCKSKETRKRLSLFSSRGNAPSTTGFASSGSCSGGRGGFT